MADRHNYEAVNETRSTCLPNKLTSASVLAEVAIYNLGSTSSLDLDIAKNTVSTIRKPPTNGSARSPARTVVNDAPSESADEFQHKLGA